MKITISTADFPLSVHVVVDLLFVAAPNVGGVLFLILVLLYSTFLIAAIIALGKRESWLLYFNGLLVDYMC